jgi:hypothetical protein
MDSRASIDASDSSLVYPAKAVRANPVCNAPREKTKIVRSATVVEEHNPILS